jgi:hypothetical protein
METGGQADSTLVRKRAAPAKRSCFLYNRKGHCGLNKTLSRLNSECGAFEY